MLQTCDTVQGFLPQTMESSREISIPQRTDAEVSCRL